MATRKPSTVRKRASSFHKRRLRLCAGPVVLECVGRTERAEWRGSGLSCLNLLRSKAAVTRDPVGLLCRHHSEIGTDVTGLPTKVH